MKVPGMRKEFLIGLFMALAALYMVIIAVHISLIEAKQEKQDLKIQVALKRGEANQVSIYSLQATPTATPSVTPKKSK